MSWGNGATRNWLKTLLVIILWAAALSGIEHPFPHATADYEHQGGTPLSFGEAVTGVLDDQTFRQIYTFNGQANDVIAVRMTRISGDLDPYLLLMNEHGEILALSDDDGTGIDAEIGFKRLPQNARYFVIATRFGQEHGSTSGEYELLLEQVGSSGASENTTLGYGSSVIGRITGEEPLFFYFMRAQRGNVINITMQRTSGNLDPHLDLATADGIVITSNDDDPLAEGTLDAGITNYTILKDGTYLIVATRFGREAGDTQGSYVLSLEQIPPEELGQAPETARLIDYGLALTGTVDEETLTRYYRFEGRRGDVITTTLSTEAGDLDPLLKLADASLTVIKEDDDTGDGSEARIAAFTLPADGMYYLLATSSEKRGGGTSGDFAIKLDGRAGIVGGRALEIAYGATMTGQLDNQTVSEEYVFIGQQGDVVRIAMQRVSSDLDSLVTLYDSDRKQITFDDDGGGSQDAVINDFTLPRDGMYILVASRFDREQGQTSGAYILTLTLVRAAN
ncbi:MAG: PPC domain-containing protein [Chloroflexi bacterium]|nr:PPC domain-containing protein [Chloroflexota bacterium]